MPVSFFDDARLRVFAAACGLKLALAPGYRSTDFEVHRNWLAITKNLPLSRWYTDATSQWTLDYPPLFAYFERLLSVFASVLAPKAVSLQSDPVEDDAATLVFQRLSVALFADVALAAVAWRLTSKCSETTTKKKTRFPPWVAFALVFASPGLLIVDSIHFQYNAPLIALLLLTVSLAQRGGRGGGDDVVTAALFAALVCSKHLFACLGPLFAFHLLGRCLGKGRAALFDDDDDGGDDGGDDDGDRTNESENQVVLRRRQRQQRPRYLRAFAASAGHALQLAAAVAAVLFVTFGPFFLFRPSSPPSTDEEGGDRQQGGGGGKGAPSLLSPLAPILSRLFPFDRGLLHAYWAANAWALVAGLDVAASAALRVVVPRLERLGLPSSSSPSAPSSLSALASALSSAARRSGSGLASGLVQRTEFAVFPALTPGASFAALAVLVAQAPALVSALRSGFNSAKKKSGGSKSGGKNRKQATPTPSFASAAQYCLLCSFVWGYHVHEKAILPVLSLSAWRAFADGDEGGEEGEGGGGEEAAGRETEADGTDIAKGPLSYSLLSLPALHALLPLLAPAPAERAAAFLLLIVHALFLLSLFRPSASKGSLGSLVAVAVVAAALSALEVFCAFAWPLAFPRLASERLPFLPLALTSLACAVGVCGCWASDAARWVRVAVGSGGGGGGGASGGSGGGRRRGQKQQQQRLRKRKQAATAAPAVSAAPAVAASPPLATRRPRRAAAAASK